jgi:hypothetical protein
MCDSLDAHPNKKTLNSFTYEEEFSFSDPEEESKDSGLTESTQELTEASNELLRGVAQELTKLEKTFKLKYQQYVTKISQQSKDANNNGSSKSLSYKEIIQRTASKGTMLADWVVPNQTYSAYLPFLRETGDITTEQFVLAYFYFEKLLNHKQAVSFVDPCCIKELYGVCCLLAFKFLEEKDFWPLTEFCNLIGVNSLALYALERHILSEILCYKLYVPTEAFKNQKRTFEEVDLAQY